MAAVGGWILVVDDDPASLELLSQVLEVARFRCAGAGDATSALEAAVCVQPDLLLIDVMLRDGGLELARDLRVRVCPQTPMIALAASPLMAQVAAQSGLFAAVIERPFSFYTLFDRIHRLLVEESGPRRRAAS